MSKRSIIKDCLSDNVIVKSSFLESTFRHIAPLRYLIAKLPAPDHSKGIQSSSIDARDRVDWAYWLSRFQYMEIRHDRIFIPAYFSCTENLNSNYPNLALTTRSRQSIPLDDIFGLSASKSDLSKFSDIVEMAKNESPELLNDDVDSLLNWGELHIFKDYGGEHISEYAWDKRKFLIQSGGSHHFAAACYRSRCMGEKRSIELDVYHINLNGEAIDKLLNDAALLHSTSDVLTSEIMDALEYNNIPFAVYDSPYCTTNQGYSCATFIIPNNKARYRKASKLLATKLEDLGARLRELVALQREGSVALQKDTTIC